jgi:hypothetical protein
MPINGPNGPGAQAPPVLGSNHTTTSLKILSLVGPYGTFGMRISLAFCLFVAAISQRALKTNDGPLRGWLVPRRPKKYQGWSDFCVRFFIVFLNSPHRETPKNVINKNREKVGFGFFVDFL